MRKRLGSVLLPCPSICIHRSRIEKAAHNTLNVMSLFKCVLDYSKIPLCTKYFLRCVIVFYDETLCIIS